MQCVSHAALLGLQVSQIVFVGCYLNGHVLNDLQSVCLQSHTLDRVVGQQSHLVYAEVAQHLGTATVVALVGLEAQVNVRIDGVESLFL